MSRFLLLLCEHQAEVEAMFDSLVRELGRELPDLGRTLAVDAKAYEGVREDGSAWEKVVRWFGFKLHLLVDSEHELPLADRPGARRLSQRPAVPTLLRLHGRLDPPVWHGPPHPPRLRRGGPAKQPQRLSGVPLKGGGKN